MFPKLVAVLTLACTFSLTLSAPVRREVPQEHSHEQFLTTVRASLNKNNPDQIKDVVFGLLGNAAAIGGAGKIKDATCLQQATADQAFSNAKAAKDVNGQVAALIYRALERNSAGVGTITAPCTSIKAVNPEIAAIQQHQDPASPNAAAVNKAIVLQLAKQIAAVGGNPQDALKSGTFKPGNLNDKSGKGNTCDTTNDPKGCIFSQNLLVPDATAAEITAAVKGVKAGGAASAPASGAGGKPAGNAGGKPAGNAGGKPAGNAGGAPNQATDTSGACPADVTKTVTVTVPAAAQATPAAGAPAAPAAGNLQKFTGALGGATAPAVNAGGRGFLVEGSDSFLNLSAALGRSCDIQHNKCGTIANSAAGKSSGLSVQKCDQQNTQCHAA